MFEIEDVHKMNDDQKEYCDPQEINGNNSLQQENGTAAGDGGRAPSAAPSDDRPLGYTVMTKFVNAIEIETSEEGFNAGRSYYVKVCALSVLHLSVSTKRHVVSSFVGPMRVRTTSQSRTHPTR